MSFTTKDRVLLTRAFRTAWKALLKQERVSAHNVERVPLMLMESIIEGIHKGEQRQRNLAAAAMARMRLYEQEVEKDSLVLH